MIGAIAGDIIGSPYEFNNIHTKDFPLFCKNSKFTDDTVATVALAEIILKGGSYTDALQDYYHRYPDRGWGGRFSKWAEKRERSPYNSWGNGSAMRVSPVGFAYDSIELVLIEAENSAKVTHNHPEGIKGAKAVACAIFLARYGESKNKIKKYIEENFQYDLSRTIKEIKPSYRFDESCQGSVPEAIIAFIESEDFEDTIRTSIFLGGDCDTTACIAGGIAEAYYGSVPESIKKKAFEFLDHTMRDIVTEFQKKFMTH